MLGLDDIVRESFVSLNYFYVYKFLNGSYLFFNYVFNNGIFDDFFIYVFENEVVMFN